MQERLNDWIVVKQQEEKMVTVADISAYLQVSFRFLARLFKFPFVSEW